MLYHNTPVNWIRAHSKHHFSGEKEIKSELLLSKNDALAEINDRLSEDMIRQSCRRTYVYKATGKVEYDEFYMKLSKSIIDEIDTVLARHYWFTEEELDFIINNDIKYRMGDELNN